MGHRSIRLLPALALLAGACADPPVFLPNGQSGSPAGALEGTVAYSGPLPCTGNGRILGAAVLEVFNVRFLPPPEGLGSTAQSLAVVPGETLFAGVRGRLTFNPDGSRWCPDPGAAPVTVSKSWSAAPLDGGVYQVRGFYDTDENFNPAISLYKVPTKGDVGGGAIDNAAEVLLGAAPKYREIALGDAQGDGTYKIPDEGSLIGGVTVTLALPLPLQPPIFHAKEVTYSTKVCKDGNVVDATPGSTDPNAVSMPSDYTLPVFAPTDPAGTQDSLIRVGFGAGVAADEVDTAAGMPFNLPVKDPAPTFTFSWQDVNGDGVLDLTGDHVPDSILIPSLYPASIFNLLDGAKDTILPQASPVVIMQGLTMYKDLVQTAFAPPTLNAPDTKVVVGLRPAVLCLDPEDFNSPALLVLTHKTDCGNQPVLTSEAQTKAALKKQFGHEVEVVEACLPQGAYAANLIYGTGQAWTLPNEAGICQATEPSTDGGKTCGDPASPPGPNGNPAVRPTLPSQRWTLAVGAPTDAAYCAKQRAAALDMLKTKYPDSKVLPGCFPE